MAVKRKTKTTTSKQKTPKATSASSTLKAISSKQTKAQILRTISEETGLTLGQVKTVFAAAGHIAKCHLIKRGSGEFAIPEMAVKIVRKTKPATKARMGRNPVTGEEIKIAPKPKRDVIKVRPLKSLKDIILNQ
jgi:nucleoid DNA-binding protein